jgi:hypothetical protein
MPGETAKMLEFEIKNDLAREIKLHDKPPVKKPPNEPQKPPVKEPPPRDPDRDPPQKLPLKIQRLARSPERLDRTGQNSV